MMPAGAKQKILFIVGAGRSGSTVLDILLGSAGNIFSTGELIHLHGRGWTNNEFCACGERVNDCELWSTVKAAWTAEFGPDAIERFLQLQRRFERIRNLFRSLRGVPEHEEYLRMLSGLLRHVRQISGAEHIVDSSKKHVRAYFMAQLPDQEVYVVHLIRDSRGVAWSKAKSLPKDERSGVQADQRPVPVGRTAREWLLTNILCSRLSRLFPGRYLRVRYEDFIANPENVLQAIGDFSGISVEEPLRNLVAGASLSPGHTVAGNRLRMSGSVRLKPDLEWREKLTREQEATVWRWTGMLLKHYGYQR